MADRCQMMKFPNLFVIGAPKAGTTSLVTYLSTHPNVLISSPKEPNYWTKELPNEGEEERTLSGYTRLYAHATARHSVCIDGSTSYCWSRTALPEIIRELPASRFVFMIRNPVSLAPSLHSEEVLDGNEDVYEFNDAWKLQGEREKGRRIPRTSPCWQKVCYRIIASLGTHLKWIRGIIPADQLHIILFDDFIRDPRSEYLRLLRFLGLVEVEPTSYAVHNSSRHPVAPGFTRAILRPPAVLRPAALAARTILHRLGVKGLRSHSIRRLALQGRISAPSEQTRSEMREYFEPEIKLLENLLSTELKEWRS